MNRACLLALAALLFLAASVSGYPVNSPVIDDFLPVGSSITGRVSLNGGASLYLQAPFKEPWSEVSIGQDGSFTIPSSLTQAPGKYKYYFNSSGERIPGEGYFILFLYDNKSAYTGAYYLFANNDSSSPDFCRPLQGDYECENELFQAREIGRFASLYYETGNPAYEDAWKGLLYANWSDNTSNSCNPHFQDFSCGFKQVVPYYSHTGVKRQADIISSLWKAYAFTRDPLIKGFAVNFSDNAPSECNVWNNDFDCGNSSDQGIMIGAYANAYLGTGREEYKGIAYNLSLESESMSPSLGLVNGYLEAYRVFGDEYFLGLSLSSYDQVKHDCIENSCPVEEYYASLLMHHSMYMLARDRYIGYGAFNVSIEYESYRNLMDQLHAGYLSGCSMEDTVCLIPSAQAIATKAFREISYNTRTENSSFYNIRTSTPVIGSDIFVHTKKAGGINNATLYFRDSIGLADPFIPSAFNNGTALINSSFVISSTFLEFFINDSHGTRYPLNGTLLIPVPLEFQELFGKLEAATFSDPKRFCNPFNTSSPGYSCTYDYMHGEYLGALSRQYFLQGNESLGVASREMGNATIDPAGIYSTCDPSIQDYSCEKANPAFPGDARRKPGVYRAAQLIKGYLEAYKSSLEPHYKDYAFSLVYTPHEECGFMAGEYDCGSPEAQGEIISALSRAYAVSGRHDIMEALHGLALQAQSMQSNDVLVSGLLDYIRLFPDETIRGMVISYLSGEPSCKEDFSCKPYELYYQNKLYWEAYAYFENQSYFHEASDLIRARPVSSEDYCDPNSADPLFQENKYVCEFPHEQGVLISSHSRALDGYVNREPSSLEINVSSVSEALFHGLENIMCKVKNVGNETLFFANLVLSSDHTLVSVDTNATLDGLSVSIENLEPNQTIYANYTINLTRAGNTSAKCFVLNFENSTFIEVYGIGEIVNVSHNKYINTFNNNTLFLNITNIHGFPLQDVFINFSYFANNSLGLLDAPDTHSIPLMLASESLLLNISFNGSYDGVLPINISASSDYNGSSRAELSPVKVMNSLYLVYDAPQGISLFSYANLSLLALNNKSYPLELHANFSFPAFVNASAASFSETLNSSENVSFPTVLFLESYSSENFSYNISVYSPVGISLFEEFEASKNNEIIKFYAGNINLGSQTSGTSIISIENLGVRALENVTVEFIYSGMNFTEIKTEPLILTEMIAGVLVSSSHQEYNANLSIDDDNGLELLVDNSTATFNFTFNASGTPLNYTLLIKTSSFNESSSFYVQDYNASNCVLTQNVTTCNLSHEGVSELNFSMVFSSEFQDSVTINYLELHEVNKTATNLSERNNDYLRIYELLPSEKLNITTSFTVSSDSEEVFLNASNDDNAAGYASFTVSRAVPGEEDSSGAGGGAGALGESENITIENMSVLQEHTQEVVLSVEMLLSVLEGEAMAPFNISLGDIDIDNSFLYKDCVLAHRHFLPVNNSFYIVTFHVNNTCNNSSPFILFERMNGSFEYSSLESRHDYMLAGEYLGFLVNSAGSFVLYSLELRGDNAVLSVFAGSGYPSGFAALSVEPGQIIPDTIPGLSIPLWGRPGFSVLSAARDFAVWLGKHWWESAIAIILLLFAYLGFSWAANINIFRPFALLKKSRISVGESVEGRVRALKQKKARLSEEEKVLVDIDIRAMYVEALIRNKKYAEAKDAFSKFIGLFYTRKGVLEEYQKKFGGDALQRLVKKTNNMLIVLEGSGEKSLGRPLPSPERKPLKKTGKDRYEKYDYYLTILKIRDFLGRGSIDEADHRLSVLEKKVGGMGDDEKDVRELLSSEIKPLKKEILNAKKAFSYKVKKRWEGAVSALKGRITSS